MARRKRGRAVRCQRRARPAAHRGWDLRTIITRAALAALYVAGLLWCMHLEYEDVFVTGAVHG